MSTTGTTADRMEPEAMPEAVGGAISAGARLVAVVATPAPGGATLLEAVLAEGTGGLAVCAAEVAAGQDRYPSLTPVAPGAFWYEREIHDLFGLVPVGHPRLDALVYPLKGSGVERPRPGRPEVAGPLDPDTSALAGHVEGEGVFTIPYGPVRSGVFETVEYLVETFGEDIPRVRVRPYLKHRGMARRFTGMSVADGTALAERVEGTMSVAHAVAFCQAVEAIAGVEPPPAAQHQRMVHAELERVAGHLDSTIRHCEGAGQSVAYARLSWEKERVLRLQAELTGHRFARGLVVPGGSAGPPHVHPHQAAQTLRAIRDDVAGDLGALMTTPSFLDRLRATGVVSPEEAGTHGAVGPVGRASDTGPDVRLQRSYGAYRHAAIPPLVARVEGDALARQAVRVEEIAGALDLAVAGLRALGEQLDGPWSVPLPAARGRTVTSVESPQGELVYLVEVVGDRLANVAFRTASFHNFALFSSSFRGDIFTDFVFIEASFGVNLAGVAG